MPCIWIYDIRREWKGKWAFLWGPRVILHTLVKQSSPFRREQMSDQVAGIPGFEIIDEEGNVIAENPGQAAAGRRSYDESGVQKKKVGEDRANTHNYLLRAPRGIWVAFSRKCKNEGITARQALVFLMKDWVKGKIEIEDLALRRNRD